MFGKKKEVSDEVKKTAKAVAREWAEAIVIAVVLAMFVKIFFFELYKIPTSSMVPVLKPGDKIFVSKIEYGPRVPLIAFRFPGIKKAPARGEVVVFISPAERFKNYIKRVIGLPGDKVEIKKGQIYINDNLITDPEISRNFYYNAGEFGRESTPIIVPENNYFCLGDNSIDSKDSRYWGFVPHADLLGKAYVIWWPPKRAGKIK